MAEHALTKLKLTTQSALPVVEGRLEGTVKVATINAVDIHVRHCRHQIHNGHPVYCKIGSVGAICNHIFSVGKTV